MRIFFALFVFALFAVFIPLFIGSIPELSDLNATFLSFLSGVIGGFFVVRILDL